MAQLPGFNPDEHKPSDPDRAGGEPLPAGWYCMYILGTDMVENSSTSKDPNGTHLVVEFEITERAHPDIKGRRAWARLTYTNKNQQAVDIGRADIAAICKAVGHTGPLADTEVLHGKNLAVKLKVRPAKGDFPATNDCAGFDQPAIRFKDGVPQPHHAAVPGGATAAPAPPAATAPTQVAPPPATVAQPAAATAAQPPTGAGPVADPTPSQTPPWQQ